MDKRLWVVTVQEIHEGYLYIRARNEDAARDLAWTCLHHGIEPRSIGHGYSVSARPVENPKVLSEVLEELSDAGPDADEDDPAFAVRYRLPEIWDP